MSNRVPDWVERSLERWYAERVEPVPGLRPYTAEVRGELLRDADLWFEANGEQLDRWIRSKRFAAFLREKGVALARRSGGLVAIQVRLKAIGMVPSEQQSARVAEVRAKYRRGEL